LQWKKKISTKKNKFLRRKIIYCARHFLLRCLLEKNSRVEQINLSSKAIAKYQAQIAIGKEELCRLEPEMLCEEVPCNLNQKQNQMMKKTKRKKNEDPI
jgi:hypothetical protein